MGIRLRTGSLSSALPFTLLAPALAFALATIGCDETGQPEQPVQDQTTQQPPEQEAADAGQPAPNDGKRGGVDVELSGDSGDLPSIDVDTPRVDFSLEEGESGGVDANVQLGDDG